MECKTFEVCDKGTFMPALAVRLNSEYMADKYLLGRAGFGNSVFGQGKYFGHGKYILLVFLELSQVQYDPLEWGDRTKQTAHQYILANFHLLTSGAVIDVEYILHETEEPKRSESENDFYPEDYDDDESLDNE